MPHLPNSGHDKKFPKKFKGHFKPFFNSCHQLQFQKNLINKSRDKLRSVELGHKNYQYPSFWAKNEFFSKKVSVTF